MRIRTILLLLAAGLMSFGCSHAGAQVPPSTNAVNLTWTPPVSPACTVSSPCTYVLSRYTLPAGNSCPAATTQYTPLNTASPAAGTSFTDTAPPAGASVCYVAQTLQGGLTSVASVPSNVVTVPMLPGPPSTPAIGTVTELRPLMPATSPQIAALAPASLTARVSGE